MTIVTTTDSFKHHIVCHDQLSRLIREHRQASTVKGLYSTYFKVEMEKAEMEKAKDDEDSKKSLELSDKCEDRGETVTDSASPNMNRKSTEVPNVEANKNEGDTTQQTVPASVAGEFDYMKDMLDVDEVTSEATRILRERAKAFDNAIANRNYAADFEFRGMARFLRMTYFLLKPQEIEVRNEFRIKFGQCMCELQLLDKITKVLTDIDNFGERSDTGDLVDSYSIPLVNLISTLYCYSDVSPELCKAIIANDDMVSFMYRHINTSSARIVEDKATDQEQRIARSSMAISYNCARKDESHRRKLREWHFVDATLPYLKCSQDNFRTTALLFLSYLVDEQQNAMLMADTASVKFLVEYLTVATDSPERKCKGWSAEEILLGISKLTVNDANKKALVDEGVLPTLVKLANLSALAEQRGATETIWLLAFDDSNKEKILAEPGAIDILQKLQNSPDEQVKHNASGALWVLRDGIQGKDVINKWKKKPTDAVADDNSHVMISYQWHDQDVLKHVKSTLMSRGIRVWMDIDNMYGSTLQAMAEAVERSSAVLVCMSEKYKDSPNCRSEAEYAYQQRKDIIPLKMERNYKADGWLGILSGTKLFFDFSGKYEYDKKINELIREINRGLKMLDGDVTDSAIIRVAASKPVSAVPQRDFNIADWLSKHDFENEKIKALSLEELVFLKEMRSEAPEYFYSFIEKNLAITGLKALMKFIKAMDDT